jgi:hypothetical protein
MDNVRSEQIKNYGIDPSPVYSKPPSKSGHLIDNGEATPTDSVSTRKTIWANRTEPLRYAPMAGKSSGRINRLGWHISAPSALFAMKAYL